MFREADQLKKSRVEIIIPGRDFIISVRNIWDKTSSAYWICWFRRALREASEAQEYEITRQIERVKQENRDRENRLWQEVENQRCLNQQRIAQERQNIQSSLDSARQNSQARIAYTQQQINNAERNLEQQIQQQTNLSSTSSLAGMIAKMFIKN